MVRALLAVLTTVAGLAGVAGLVVAGDFVRNMNRDRWDAWRVRRAGFSEKRAPINGTTLNYAEGPANGPPLLLIHGQLLTWTSYSRVLLALSRHFHVFAVDLHGHGKSDRAHEKYTANALAEDMLTFIEQVIGKPAIVSGHSSGGLVAANLAAKAPEWVPGVILEDPPFFASVHPRAFNTFDYIDLSCVAHDFLSSGEDDFTSFYIRHGAVWDLFRGAKARIQEKAARYRRAHPDRPLKLYFMPPVVNRLFGSMDNYDPRFGEAFYNNSFHDDFDHAETLRNIRVPTVLIHTDLDYDDNGILVAAMDSDDARRARSLLQDVLFHQVSAGNTFHFEKPLEYVRIVRDLWTRMAARGKVRAHSI